MTSNRVVIVMAGSSCAMAMMFSSDSMLFSSSLGSEIRNAQQAGRCGWLCIEQGGVVDTPGGL